MIGYWICRGGGVIFQVHCRQCKSSIIFYFLFAPHGKRDVPSKIRTSVRHPFGHVKNVLLVLLFLLLSIVIVCQRWCPISIPAFCSLPILHLRRCVPAFENSRLQSHHGRSLNNDCGPRITPSSFDTFVYAVMKSGRLLMRLFWCFTL